MNSDLYSILGIERNATEKDIQTGFKRKAIATHPDKYLKLYPDATADQKLNNLIEFHVLFDAYSILSDKSKREIYDLYGMDGFDIIIKPNDGSCFCKGPHKIYQIKNIHINQANPINNCTDNRTDNHNNCQTQ